MTTNNYTSMSNQELLDELNNLGICLTKLKVYLPNHCPELWAEIIRRTSYLDLDESISCRMYCIEHNLTEHPICIGEVDGIRCTNYVKWDRKARSFKRFCSCKCAQRSKETLERRKETCMQKYGCQNVSQSQEIKDKISEAWHNMPCQVLKEIREQKIHTCTQKYGGIGFASNELSDKVKEKVRERFGVNNASQSEEIKQKKILTYVEHYGVQNPLQSEEVKEKIKSTCIEKYGVENPFQYEEVKEKIRKTCIERYGVEHPSSLPQVNEKQKNTNLSRYGVEYPNQSKQMYDRIIKTNLERYGVKSYTQTYEYHKKKRHKYHSEKYPGLTFDSKWEVKVYEFCKDNNVEVEYQPNISYDYEYDGNTYTYHPDFLINGKVYEVKGDNFFRINESTSKEEMFCPYGRKKLGEEKWKWLCGKYEAKYQCMVQNGVTIIREIGINNLSTIIVNT